MKVVQVIPSTARESSGPSYFMQSMVRSFRLVDIEVWLCSLDKYSSKWSRIGNVGWSPRMYADLKVEANRVDVIHNNSLWMMPNLYPYWAARGKPVKVVTSPHGTLSPWALNRGKLKKKIFGALLQYPALKRTDMFHATCEKEYGEIRAAGYKQPVAIIPIGIDIPDVEKQNHADGRKKVVFFGRLHKVKAIDHLVLAWGRVASRFPDWDLEVAGPDGGALHELKALVDRHSVPRVKFVGEINGPAKYEFLSSADICVLPSHTENFGVTVAEALACSTPVIASQGTPWEKLNQMNAGWWIPIGVEPLAEQLAKSMSLGVDSLRMMGDRGREWMRRDYSWDMVGCKMKTSYEWLLGKADKPEWIIED